MFTDLRYVLRSLARAKGFTAIVVITLGLGLGSAAAIFSVVDWVLFRMASFPPDLVLLGNRDKQGHLMPAVIDVGVEPYRNLSSVFAETAATSLETVNVVVEGEPVGSYAGRISANLLPLFGVVPAHGRGFLPEEERAGHDDVVVIRHEFWQQQLQGTADVIGRKIVVDQSVCTVVGVLPPSPVLPGYMWYSVMRPLVFRSDPANPGSQWLQIFARLQPGVTPAQAAEALATVRLDLPPRLQRMFAPSEHKPVAVTLWEAHEVMRRDVYWVLVAAVGFLYAVACLNTTNLLVVRLLGRRRELSIRLALGGGRARLIRLVLLDSGTLSLLASAAGLLVANWLVPLLLSLSQSGGTFRWIRWSLDWRAITVLIVLSMATALVITFVPALRIARASIHDGLKEGGTALGEGRSLARMRGLFVMLQAAFAVILLTGAGLMIRTFDRLQSVPLGFEISHRMRARLAFPRGHLAGKEERLDALKRIQRHLCQVPGVLGASYGTDTLLAGYYFGGVKAVRRDGTEVDVKVDHVSPDFFETSGMKLLRGRMVNPTGGEVMINESLARAVFGDEDPVGQVLRKTEDAGSGAGGWQVVGLVADVRDQLRSAPGNRAYAPETWWPPAMDMFILRVAREPDAVMAAAIKRAIYEFDPKIVATQVQSLEEVRSWQTGEERFAASVLKVLAGIALLLAVVGMFSVLAYTVDRRMGEFGVRMAFGATGRDLARLVLWRGITLAVGGVIVGLAGAWALVRYLQSLLYATPPHDPLVLGSVALLLLISAILACALPARRATKVDVAKLLRSE